MKIRFSVPATVSKLGGGVRWPGPVAGIMAAVLFFGAVGTLGVLRGSQPPNPVGAARWWLRTGDRHDVNILQVDFMGMRDSTEDFFVTVEGTTTLPSDTGSTSQVTVHTFGSLERNRKYPELVSTKLQLQTTSAAPDPHRLSIGLYQRRSLFGLLPLPPRRVRLFWPAKVDIQDTGAVAARP